MGWFSNLHTLSKEFDEGDPQQIAALPLPARCVSGWSIPISATREA
jgi:hypothetical protein